MMKKFLVANVFLLLCFNSYSQCGHYFENRLSALSNVRFWDTNNGFVIGGSSLMTTHDGGGTWEAYQLPYYEAFYYRPLNDIELIDSNKAIVVGADGILLYTENKGIDWKRKVGLKGLENFTGVSFINDKIGFLVGVNDYLVNNTPFLYNTNDGGETWTEVSSNISSIYPESYGPKDVLFLDENIGYFWGGKYLFKTVDGGKLWVQITNPSDSYIQKIQFIDSQTAYLSGGDYIYKTIDTGKSWEKTPYYVEWTTGAFTANNGFLYYSNYVVNGIKKININEGSEINSIVAQQGFLTDVYFVNKEVGYAVGKKKQGSPNMGRFIYKTVDGGLNWTGLDSGASIDGNVNYARYFNKIAENEFVFSTVSGGGNTGSYVLLSKDDGVSWKKIYETPAVVGRTLYAYGNYLSHFRYSNSINYGEGYIISESFDKGVTWKDGPILKMNDLPSGLDFSENSLTQISENDIYNYTYSGNLYHSTTKGKVWKLITTPNNLLYKKYAFTNSKEFILIGSDLITSEPVIYKTVDSGLTWELIVRVSGAQFNISSSNWFDIFNASKIYISSYTTLGSKLYIYDMISKIMIQRDVPYFINKIKSIDANSIMILENLNGYIYVSNDDGLNWSRKFWGNYDSSYPNIFIENKDSVYLWDVNFIQKLTKYIPQKPELILGNSNSKINVEQEYIIPVDLFSLTEWYLESGGTLILDKNTSYYKVKVLWETKGIHTLKVKRANECGDSSFVELLINVGEESTVDNVNLIDNKVFPNPFDTNLNISVPVSFQNTDLSITIYDILGQIVYNQKIISKLQVIELNDLSAQISRGVYFVKVESKTASFIQKILKK